MRKIIEILLFIITIKCPPVPIESPSSLSLLASALVTTNNSNTNTDAHTNIHININNNVHTYPDKQKERQNTKSKALQQNNKSMHNMDDKHYINNQQQVGGTANLSRDRMLRRILFQNGGDGIGILGDHRSQRPQQGRVQDQYSEEYQQYKYQQSQPPQPSDKPPKASHGQAQQISQDTNPDTEPQSQSYSESYSESYSQSDSQSQVEQQEGQDQQEEADIVDDSASGEANDEAGDGGQGGTQEDDQGDASQQEDGSYQDGDAGDSGNEYQQVQEEDTEQVQQYVQSDDNQMTQQDAQNQQEIVTSHQPQTQQYYKMKFDKYKTQNSIQFQPEQQNYRFTIYEKNVKSIRSHNLNRKTYKQGATQFAALQKRQFLDMYIMTDPPKMPMLTAPPMSVPPNFKIQPVDWRYKMAEAKHQGKCGSCWAFSVLGVLEAHIMILRNNQVELSVQHLVDCCRSGCNGCRGGWPVSALNFIQTNGVAKNSNYPYKGKDQACPQKIKSIKYLDESVPYMQINNVDTLLFGILQGPVSVIVDASTWDPLYKQGVFDGCPSNNQKIHYNHAVICVGVSSKGVWIVRNSWGTAWGQQGHIHLPKGNSCGIADMGVIPTLKKQIKQAKQSKQYQASQYGLGLMPP